MAKFWSPKWHQTMREIEFRWLVGNEDRVLQFRYLNWVLGDLWEWTAWATVKEVHK